MSKEATAQLPFGVGGGLVAIKTLLSRDPCVHANTAIQMIDAILTEQPAQQQEPEWYHFVRHGEDCFVPYKGQAPEKATPLYTSPPTLSLAQERSSDEQPAQQESVGYVAENGVVDWNGCAPPILTDLYTSPQRTWVGLTDEEFQWIYDHGRTPAGMMELVEAKLKEKNSL